MTSAQSILDPEDVYDQIFAAFKGLEDSPPLHSQEQFGSLFADKEVSSCVVENVRKKRKAETKAGHWTPIKKAKTRRIEMSTKLFELTEKVKEQIKEATDCVAMLRRDLKL
jgi:hypothetical protein